MLASVGIFLDDPPATGAITHAVVQQRDEEAELITREKIREILIAAGVPARNLEWLTASCPGIEYARGYVPPACEDGE
jgi:hypothetical protein